MKNKILTIALAAAGVAVLFAAPVYVPKMMAGGIKVPGGDLAEVEKTVKDPETFIEEIINTALTILAGIAVLFIIWGGFKYIMGGKTGAEEAKPIITSAIIGLVIIFVAYALVNWVVKLFIK